MTELTLGDVTAIGGIVAGFAAMMKWVITRDEGIRAGLMKVIERNFQKLDGLSENRVGVAEFSRTVQRIEDRIARLEDARK